MRSFFIVSLAITSTIAFHTAVNAAQPTISRAPAFNSGAVLKPAVMPKVTVMPKPTGNLFSPGVINGGGFKRPVGNVISNRPI